MFPRKLRVIPGLLIAAAICVAPLPAHPLTQEDEIFEKGKDDILIGNFYRAASRLRRLLTEYPDTKYRKEALLLLSSACVKNGMPEKGREYLQQLILEARNDVYTPVAPASKPTSTPYDNVFAQQPPFFGKARSSAPPTPVVADRQAAVYFAVVAGEPVGDDQRIHLVERLEAAGLQPTVARVVKNCTVHRLLNGRYLRQSHAQKRQKWLRATCGGSPFIVKVGDAYHLFAGSYVSRENALDEERRLERLGIHVELATAEAPLRVWRVTVGTFRTEAEASAAASALLAKGTSVKVERIEEQ